MNPVADAFVRSWPFDPGLLLGLGLAAIIYLRGWRVLRRRHPERWGTGQATAFLSGLTAVYLALASPIEPFSFFFLEIHMVQHLVLMMAAPPLIWLGAPLFPFLFGLPAAIRTYWIAPCFRWAPLRRFFRFLAHPVTAWLLFVSATWFWHIPVLYEAALRSNGWHYLQHLTFLLTGLIFWHPVIRPYPSRPRWSRWLLFPYLILADLQNTVLAALLTFSDRVLYPHYAQVPRLGGLTALDDQATAGVIMWVPGSLVFLLPLFWIAISWLSAGAQDRGSAKTHWSCRAPALQSDGKIPLPLVSEGAPALARSRALAFLRWRHARLCFQIPMLLLAGVLIYDGWTGPDVGPMNLAGVLPWIHWRGLVILGLLIAGNVFCLACPFTVPRTLARRFFPQHFSWPHWLRNKWLAVFLLILFFWAYEVFTLWDSPWLTAWLIVAYFVAALVIDSFFRGAAFCKYVCPIGQFNFVQSLVSPLEVKVREPEVCSSCHTKDCIRGNAAARGCELELFLPGKSSNMDCTLCLDCIHACPHDNIGFSAGIPAAELWHDPPRSGIGRFGKRTDLAVLVLLLVFAAFANAAGMVGPVVDWLDRLRQHWGLSTAFWPATIYYLVSIVVLPIVAVVAASRLSRAWAGLPMGWLEVAKRQVYALIPLGFAMWLSHYCFHLLTSYESVIPVTQRFADLGTPDWSASCCVPVMDWLLRLEILFLDIGLLLSLYTAYRIALNLTPDLSRALRALAPWAVLLLALFAVGIWIVLQPMQMRGTLGG
ncbi:MAG TPA: cytochrome c oxidase assembly protein [Gemmataceae bacterium]|nr:cytochrome c oxidase assembly protein [Gemmataceae bacterium]